MDKYNKFFINNFKRLISLDSWGLFNKNEIKYFIKNDIDLQLRVDIKSYELAYKTDHMKHDIKQYINDYNKLKKKCERLNINYEKFWLINPILKITEK